MPLVVHFKKPSDWRASVNIHYWDTTPAIPPTACVRGNSAGIYVLNGSGRIGEGGVYLR